MSLKGIKFSLQPHHTKGLHVGGMSKNLMRIIAAAPLLDV